MNKNNYTYKKLGEVCEILNGFAFKSEKYVDKGIRVIRITNVQKGRIEDNDPQYYPIETTTEIKRYMLKEGDLLMSLTGNVGRVGILQSTMLPAALNQRVACVRLKNNDIILDFLFHYFNSDLFENNCIYSAKGIAQKNMSTEWLKEQKIPVPPLATQRKIVAELDCLNNIIAKKRLQLQDYDRLAQALFHQTFGDPVDNDMGWEVKKLGEVCEMNPSKREVLTLPLDTLCSFLGMAQVSEEGKIDLSITKKLEEVKNGFTYFSENDVLFAKITPCMENGKGAIVRNLVNGIGFGSTEFHVVRPNNKITAEFIYTLFSLKKFRHEAAIKMTGSAGQKRVPISFLANYTIYLPPLYLQQQFAAKIETIEAQKARIRQSVAEVQTLLNYTMDKYFG